MTTITSWSLRIFPGRHRTTWALTWRVERQSRFNDRRLNWGVLPLSRDDLQALGYGGMLRAIADALDEQRGVQGLPEGAREPRGAVGGGSHGGLGLPGIDPDE